MEETNLTVHAIGHSGGPTRRTAPRTSVILVLGESANQPRVKAGL